MTASSFRCGTSTHCGLKVSPDQLTRFGLTHTFETYEGDHSNHVADRLEQKVLPFFSQQLAFEAPRTH